LLRICQVCSRGFVAKSEGQSLCTDCQLQAHPDLIAVRGQLTLLRGGKRTTAEVLADMTAFSQSIGLYDERNEE
jgi:hypothetical protein